MRITMSALIAALLSTTQVTAQMSCNMDLAYVHEGSGDTIIYQSPTGLPSLFYTADMDVNTDGSPKSYHPDDPKGQSIALNNMGNGITGIYTSLNGKNIGCSPRQGDCYQRYISTFNDARDSDYHPRSPWITTYGIIPWKYDKALGRDIPCTDDNGYFISQTAYTLYRGDACDQARYLDSTTINSNVLPSKTSWQSQGVVTDGFDLVVLFGDDGKIVFGINGDRGPANKIGEVSVSMATRFKGQEPDAIKNYRDVKAFSTAKAHYLIFPTVDIKRRKGRNFTQADINKIGIETLNKWGGIDRLRKCASNLKIKRQ